MRAETRNWASGDRAGYPSILLIAGLGTSFCVAAVYQPALTFAIALGGTLAMLVFRQTSLSLKLVLLLGGIPLENLGVSDIHPTQKPLLGALGGTTVDGICLLVLSTCFAILLSRSRELLVPGRFRTYLYFVGFFALSLAYSDNRLDGLRLVLKVAYPVLIFFVTLKVIKTERNIDSALPYWIAGGLVATLTGVGVLLFRGAAGFMTGGDFRYSSGLLYASPFSMYMFALFALCYGLWRAGRGSHYGALALLFGVQVLLAQTRITWVAMAVGVLVIEGCMGRSLRSLVKATSMIAFAGLVFFYVMQRSTGLQHRFFGEELDPGNSVMDSVQTVNLSGRNIVWATTVGDFWSHNRWVGQGAGSSSLLLTAVFEESAVPHNEYLRILHDAGAVGLALFLVGIFRLFRFLRSLVQRSTTPQQKALTAVAVALLAGYMVVAVSDNPLDYYFILSQYVFFAIGIAAAVIQENRWVAVGQDPS